ncbi:hypothetical protein HWV62_11705 [Athelia sp. TMB]|nr:hypothetical protein HWV62_32171 [Athelia sp. TMB]KAF7984750.1 hypothetical protein HWV62_11705 [Athelia sp. TMB]
MLSGQTLISEEPSNNVMIIVSFVKFNLAKKFLFRHSNILAVAGLCKGVKSDDTENHVLRSLRAHCNEKIDIRMIVSEPREEWEWGQHAGLYEIRRKDSETMLQSSCQSYSKEQWESRTIYMENIPLQSRSVSGIASLTLSLLSKTQAPAFDRVQNVILPPHQQDGPNDVPQCKGFGLVVLSNTEDVETLLREWPWSATARLARPDAQAVHEAAKFGLRTLPRRRWDELKEEYLRYQKSTLEELVAFNDGSFSGPTASTSNTTQDLLAQAASLECPSPRHSDESPYEPQTTLDSEFPLNCLVFVRNVHWETNKTALRKIFHTALGTASASGLDYVDYIKGADTCYLRFTAPHYTHQVLEYFGAHLIKQSSGLDDTGATGTAGDCITMEIVQGKREAVYWEKVPEKVRWKAVEIAVSAAQVS